MRPSGTSEALRTRRLLVPFGRLRLRDLGSRREPRFYSLHVTIGALFTTLVLVLGVTLVLYSFSRHRTLALDASAMLFSEVSRNTAGAARELYAPIETLVEQSARLNVGDGETLDELPLSIDYFAESLVSHPQLDAIYLGFDNGDFFLVRALREDALTRRLLDAPDEAIFVVQRIERDRFEQPRYLTTYHDGKLRQLGLNRDFATGYDPRRRPWYHDAKGSENTIATGFYRFFTSGAIGVTLARRMQGGGAVIGADLRLETISTSLQSPSLPASARVLLFTEEGEILAYNDAVWLARRSRVAVRGRLRTPQVSDIGQPEVAALFERFVGGERDGQMTLKGVGGPWFGSVSPIAFGPYDASGMHVAILVPEASLLAAQREVRLNSALLSLSAVAIAVSLTWWLSASIARSANELARETLLIQRLELDEPITVRSRVREIDRLARALGAMKWAIQRFVALSEATAGEKEPGQLAALALEEIGSTCAAANAAVLLLSDDGKRLVRIGERRSIDPDTGEVLEGDYRSDVVELPDAAHPGPPLRPDQHAAIHAESVIIDDVDDAHGHDTVGYRSRSILAVPMRTHRGRVVGVIHLGDPARRVTSRRAAFSRSTVAFVEALASHVAMAFENQRLTEARRESFETLVRLLATAIDAKSPHTGKHCQRVPILCTLLAEAASESTLPPFRDYTLTETGRHELDLASWLHDCGKITTPEHLVDKATKLETVHNRIHEIRTRFEVLWRDAEIEYLRTRSTEPGAREARARRVLGEKRKRLRDDFAFIAECNLGTEPLSRARGRRVREIAARRWLRHFDDTLGLSRAERERHAAHARGNGAVSATLPVHEPLLADKPYHRVERGEDIRPWGDNRFGFDMTVPPHELDAGEVHNLLVTRGTLTEEERFRINDHVVRTIEMLHALPFPKELARVPDIAGNHHERLDRSGYPRRLGADALGIEDRIIAIADVFEALTAADRPYREGRTLDEAIAIMRGMCERGELCGELFELFVGRELHLAYATRLRDRPTRGTTDDFLAHGERRGRSLGID